MSQLFFTKAAALRILQAQGIAACCVEAIRIYKGSIQVTYSTKSGRCSTFLSKSAFYNDFITFRIEGARNCTVQRWSTATYTSRYDVYSKDGENTRTVDVYGMPNCSCPDYEKQRHYLGRAIPGCKHIMAVMGQLGHASLQDYRDAQASIESKKRCTSCNGSGNICDWNGNITERCHDCRGSGYKKLVESVELANFDLIGGGWDEPTSTTATVVKKITPTKTRKTAQPDPFGGFVLGA